MHEISRNLGPVTPLGADRERELALRRREMSPEAWKLSPERAEMIRRNVPLALLLAARYGHRRLGQDAASIALERLCAAVDGFDPERARLTTYAATAIRTELNSAVAEQALMIRIPTGTFWQLGGRRRASVRPDVAGAAAAAMGCGPLGNVDVAGDDDGPSDLDVARAGAVHDALGVLDEGELALVRAVHYPEPGEARSPYEAGKAMGLNRAQAEARIRRAYRKLRAEVARRGAVPASEGGGRS